MNSSENTGGSTRSDRLLIEDDIGDPYRQWTVVAVAVEADRVGLLPIGTVVAADLELAAGQLCDRVPEPDSVTGAPYLVASSSVLEMDRDAGRAVPVPQASWVNRVQWAGNGWSPGRWVPAAGGLGRLEPRRWRTA
ncbi:hypothetical protein [Nocardia acidivorans]|uniref:hypothetical protein n=1 Tax=Nocardia acidivorans TaxID=404580 RepID=UPI00082EA4CA|nr:hypothetical protein [Nocardia acidivorans]